MTSSSPSTDRSALALRVRRATKQYGTNTVLDVGAPRSAGEPGPAEELGELTLRAGEIRALVGENGAGKSTLIGILSGVVAPTSADIELDGRSFEAADPAGARAGGVAAVLQEPITVPAMSVTDNLLLGLTGGSAAGPRRSVESPWGRRRRAAAVAAHVDYPLPLGAPVALLTPEQRKFIELARALSTDPRVLIVDEMTASLTSTGVDVLARTLRDFVARGGAVIYISHYLEEVFQLCDSVTVLKDGAVVTTRSSDGLDIDRLSALMVGREVQSDLYGSPDPARREDDATSALDVVGLRVDGCVHDVSFSVGPGEIVGLAGLEGSGTVDVSRSLFGDRVRAGGTISIAGRAARLSSPLVAMREGVSLLPTDREHEGLHVAETITRNLTLPSLARLYRGGFGTARAEQRAASRFVDAFGIRSRGGSESVAALSGGNRQKVALGRWLMREAPVLVLENPTRGVDVGAKVEIYRLIRRAASDGAAVVLVTDELPELIGMSDRILTMRRGEVVGRHRRDDAPSEEQLIAEMVS